MACGCHRVGALQEKSACRSHSSRAPAPSDTGAEQHGTHFFIAEEIAGPLSDIVLDVSPAVADDGSTPMTHSC
jgi:hypothetical protein